MISKKQNNAELFCNCSNLNNQDRFLSVKEVSEIVGLAVSTIWLKVSQNALPAPYKISTGTTRWSLIEIMEWMDSIKSGGHGNE